MTEQNLFQPIDTIAIYGDSIGKVTLYDSSYANTSEEQRIWTVTTVSSLAYGNESAKNPEALYARLKEIHHDSLFEFVRNGYGSCGIASSMRHQPYAYHDDYTTNAFTHESTIACFRIKVPLFVRSQFMRHRSASYLEMSRRYTKDSKVPFEFWSPSGYSYDPERAMNEYNAAIESGLHTQVAARFLPQTVYTEFYCMFEVEGLRNFFALRLDSHSQSEIRETAEAMLKLLQLHQPELYEKVRP